MVRASAEELNDVSMCQGQTNNDDVLQINSVMYNNNNDSIKKYGIPWKPRDANEYIQRHSHIATQLHTQSRIATQPHSYSTTETHSHIATQPQRRQPTAASPRRASCGYVPEWPCDNVAIYQCGCSHIATQTHSYIATELHSYSTTEPQSHIATQLHSHEGDGLPPPPFVSLLWLCTKVAM